jgi:hypothetical protein
MHERLAILFVDALYLYASAEALLIRAARSAAFLLLHAVLGIGQLCRCQTIQPQAEGLDHPLP